MKHCNCCGKELNLFDVNQDIFIHKKLGYGSEFDFETVEIRFCCECFDKLIKRCKISPTLEVERD